MSRNIRSAPDEKDWRWQAIVRRDAAADGKFYYSVRTTGVYCRPSCPSRQPKPGNLAFHLSPEAAEAQGYRACKRCKPRDASSTERQTALIADICRRIETSEQVPKLQQLAQMAHLSAYHFHRLFKRVTGLTPKRYASAKRAERVRQQLEQGRPVTQAIFAAGFNSGARFYATSRAVLGMTASAYRGGGKDTDICFAIGISSLGAVLVARSPKGVCAILLGDDPEALARDIQDRFPHANLVGNDAGFEQLVAQIVALVEQPGIGVELPLDIRGTAFQQRVWEALQQIPAGSTATYAQIAQRIGAPRAVRAVAQACAANSLAVAVPCHRVVRTDGSLSGYRWGVRRKRTLLEREAGG